MMLHVTSRVCPSLGRRASLVAVLAVACLALFAGRASGLAYASAPSLRTYLICYRSLLASQAEPETSWWASEFEFFVTGGEEYRELLRSKTDAPMVRYMNVNNITRSSSSGQLAGFVEWAAMLQWLQANGLPRERMFIHFCQDTVCRPASMPATSDISTENRFTWVVADGVDLTAAAWSGTLPPTGLLAGARQSLAMAMDERFDSVVFDLAKPIKRWMGQWEYLTASGWAPLSVCDGTSGFRRSGTVSFVPPRAWVRASDGLYWVRLRSGNVKAGPALRSVRGRDYVVLGTDGYHFPGWQPLADKDGDDYLNPTELNSAGGAGAHFPHEARVPSFWVGRYLLNVADPQVQEWNEFLASQAMAWINPGYDGIFVDNGWYEMPLDNLVCGGQTWEMPDAATWQAGTMACLDAVKRAAGAGPVILNTGNYTKPIYEEYLQHVDGWLGEWWIRPMREFTMVNLTLPRTRDQAGKIGLIHARLDPIDGDADRGKVLALALYYLVAGQRTYLFPGSNYGAQPYDANWYGALEVEIGQPLGEAVRVEASVPVYARDYQYALVLAKPLPRWDANYTDGEWIALPSGCYRPVLADGTLGEVISDSIFLRNAEGAILVKEQPSLGAPARQTAQYYLSDEVAPSP